MPSYSFSRLERCYLQVQPTFGLIPNTSGTASVGNANACRFISMSMQNDTALLERPDKTGTRSAEGMTGGRRATTWSLEMSTHANGTPGTAPDCDPILQAIFGQTAAVGSGTAAIVSSTATTPIVLTTGAHGITSGTFEMVSVAGHLVNTEANGVYLAYAASTTQLTLIGSNHQGLSAGGATGTVSKVKRTYTFTDEITFFTLWSFRLPSTLDQRVAHTCVVQQASFSLNQDVATWSVNGEAVWGLRKNDFASSDTTQRGGLTSFPDEPSAPITSGVIIPGFTGRFVAGQSVATTSAAAFAANALYFPTVRNVSITVQTNNMLVKDTFGSYYSTLTEGDVRNISLNFGVYDDDSAAVQQLKAFGDSKTPVDFVINLGTVIGNVWVFTLKNVYLASHVLNDGQLRFEAAFSESRATTSNLAVRDEFSLTIA